ncbi:MAG: AzlD domain-containing protein [Angustibacter sp.]
MGLTSAILVACGCAFVIKLVGHAVPQRWVQGDGDNRRSRGLDLLPVALLAALVIVQAVDQDGRLVLDARVAGVLAAVTALLLRAPFLVVVVVAAAVAAGVRAAGWA